MTGLVTILKLLRNAGQEILKIKNTKVGRGVDLAREERLKACDDCVDIFRRIFKSE